MTGRLSVRGMEEFAARADQLSGIETHLRAALGRYVPPIVGQVWTPASALEHARTRQDRAFLAGASHKATATSTTIMGATSPRRPGPAWQAVEFGVSPSGRARFVEQLGRSPRGTGYRMRRRALRGLPDRVPTGRVLYPAGRAAMRRIFAAYYQTVVRTMHELVTGEE
ncbi:MAG: hypothetical protein FWF90_15640 [Promicromonosporaceae bacterium]|nr:hypothetical protein [Promicromonosporaceae bacterium]